MNSNSPISNIPEIPPFILYINNPLLSEKGVVGNSWVRNLRVKFLLSLLDWKNQEDGKFEDFWLKNLGGELKKKIVRKFLGWENQKGLKILGVESGFRNL